MRIFYLR